MNDDIFSLEDQRRIEIGLSVRENIITELTKDCKLPTDEKDRDFLLRSIEGMDTTILRKARLNTKDKEKEAQEQVANAIGELLRRVSNTKSDVGIISDTSISNDIKVTDKVPGEDVTGVSGETIRNEVLNLDK